MYKCMYVTFYVRKVSQRHVYKMRIKWLTDWLDSLLYAFALEKMLRDQIQKSDQGKQLQDL